MLHKNEKGKEFKTRLPQKNISLQDKMPNIQSKIDWECRQDEKYKKILKKEARNTWMLKHVVGVHEKKDMFNVKSIIQYESAEVQPEQILEAD